MTRFLGILSALLVASAAAQAGPTPTATVDQLDTALLEIMHEGRATPFQQRYAQLAPVIQQAFDLPAILAASVGPRWNDLSPGDKDQLNQALFQFTVASYVANFNSYSGERFEVAPDTRAIGAEQVVSTRIVPTSGVLLDGTISRVAVQRSDFRSLLERSPSALVDSLQQKVRDLSGGAELQ
jgi:phospholipid transport system substrate-binding protein